MPMTNFVSISLLQPNPKNAEYFSPPSQQEHDMLLQSIKEQGIRDPIIVLPDYTIISGHVRYEIALELGFKRVQVIIRDESDEEAEYLLIAYNEERRVCDDPIKKAKRAAFLKQYWGVRHGGDRKSKRNGFVLIEKTIADVAEAIGEDVRTTQNLLKLNDLIPTLQKLVSQDLLGQNAAYGLAIMTEKEQRNMLGVFGEAGVCGMSRSDINNIRKQVKCLEGEKESMARQIATAQDREKDLERQIETLSQKPDADETTIGDQDQEKYKQELSALESSLQVSRQETDALLLQLKALKENPIERIKNDPALEKEMETERRKSAEYLGQKEQLAQTVKELQEKKLQEQDTERLVAVNLMSQVTKLSTDLTETLKTLINEYPDHINVHVHTKRNRKESDGAIPFKLFDASIRNAAQSCSEYLVLVGQEQGGQQDSQRFAS